MPKVNLQPYDEARLREAMGHETVVVGNINSTRSRDPGVVLSRGLEGEENTHAAQALSSGIAVPVPGIVRR